MCGKQQQNRRDGCLLQQALTARDLAVAGQALGADLAQRLDQRAACARLAGAAGAGHGANIALGVDAAGRGRRLVHRCQAGGPVNFQVGRVRKGGMEQGGSAAGWLLQHSRTHLMWGKEKNT